MSSDKKILLVYGYIREIEEEYKIRSIPKEIREIIYLYQKFSDEWDKKVSHQDLIISGSSIRWENQNEMTAFGSYAVSEGIWNWKLKIKSLVGDMFIACPYIGIIESEDENTLIHYQDRGNWQKCGYQLCAGNNGLWTRYGQCITRDINCVWNRVDDILEMILDLNDKTLRFVLNGQDCGVAFDEISDASYRLAITCWGGDTAEIQLL